MVLLWERCTGPWQVVLLGTVQLEQVPALCMKKCAALSADVPACQSAAPGATMTVVRLTGPGCCGGLESTRMLQASILTAAAGESQGG